MWTFTLYQNLIDTISFDETFSSIKLLAKLFLLIFQKTNTLEFDIVSIISAIKETITILAIIIGGIWTYHLFILRRHQHQKLEIYHDLTEVPLNKFNKLLSIVVIIKNTGEVAISIGNVILKLSQILPLIKPLRVCLDNDGDLKEFLLKTLGSNEKKWPKEKIAWPELGFLKSAGNHWIEPGNSQKIAFDFIVNHSVKTIRIESSFENNQINKSILPEIFSTNNTQTNPYFWNNVSIHTFNKEKETLATIYL